MDEVLIAAILLVVVAGPLMGIIAFFGLKKLSRHMERLEQEVQDLRHQVNTRHWEHGAADKAAVPTAPQAAPPPDPEPLGPVWNPETELTEARSPADVQLDSAQANYELPESLTGPEAATPQPAAPPPPPLPWDPMEALARHAAPHRGGMEFTIGTKWMNWVGALFMMLFVAYGLKYSYDNAWIGPKGRLAIGAFFGMAAIAAGEHFRRKNWAVLFQTLTGLGIATFYACVFFSFQVYHLSSAGVAFGLSVCVTALAVLLAVVHNSIAVAIVAVIGGFLSPVLLSTGENLPYMLFTYILVLDLVAMSAAYFRRWHALDLLCFVGTALMLSSWYVGVRHLPGQMPPALVFISLFYLVFLLIPTLHTLVRKLPGTREGTTLIVGNALFSATMFYLVLYPKHPHALGFIVLGQAALVFVLFRAWAHRVGSGNVTAHSLLLIALALVVAAVPLHMSRYGLSIVWALEGALLVYVGLRYASNWTRGIGAAALVLSAWSLLNNLPLHTTAFLPVLNVPFGSWLLVIAAAMGSAWLLWKRSAADDPYRQWLTVTAFLVGFLLLWILPAYEAGAYWTHNYSGLHRNSHQMTTVLVVWSVMGTALVMAIHRGKNLHEGMDLLAGCAFLVTTGLFLLSLTRYNTGSDTMVFNAAFLPRLVFIGALVWSARIYARAGKADWEQTFEAVAHIAFALLMAMEVSRWGRPGGAISPRIAFSLVSVVWGLQAFTLLWLGLYTRRRFRRILGFAFFAVVIIKVLLVDTRELEKVFRILSFGGTGILLLAGGYFFQKYSGRLLADEEEERANVA